MTQVSEYVRLCFGSLAIAQLELDRGISHTRCTEAYRARKRYERALLSFARHRLTRRDLPAACIAIGFQQCAAAMLKDKTPINRELTLNFLSQEVEMQLRIG